MDATAYTTLGHPTAFGSVTKLKAFYPHVSQKRIERDLSSQDAYTRTRQVKRPDFNFTYAGRTRELLEGDLMDVSQLRTRNRNISFFLCIVDAFSRYAFVEPMVRKTAASTRAAFEAILERMPRSEEILKFSSDSGTEFLGTFSELLRNRGIQKIVARRHSSIVERFQGSFKRLLARYMVDSESVRFVDVADRALETYNRRWHRTIGTSPHFADQPEHVEAVRYALALGRADSIARQHKKKPKFKVGDLVRVQRNKHTWQRTFHPTFSTEFYKVVAVHTSLPEIMYSVKGLSAGAVVERDRKYSTELQRVRPEAFKIAKVHWRKKRVNEETGAEQVLVDWAGLPPGEYSTYVNRADLVNYKRSAVRLWE